MARHIRAWSVGVLVLLGCTHRPSSSLTRNAIATLGAPDGYLFAFSPFNCSLRESQIDAMNALAARTRRTGKVLTLGHELKDTAIARRTVEDMGIHLASVPFATTQLARTPELSSLRKPLAVAIRGGQIIAILSGPDAERIDEWVAWIEHR